MSHFNRLYAALAAFDDTGMFMLRGGLVVVLLWIGALKFARYEGEGIVPLVSNSPLMAFFYRFRAPAYRAHMNKEGDLSPSNRAWNAANGTYRFSHGLGVVILLIGIMIALSPVLPQLAAIGSLLSPECPARPYLSSSRRRRPGYRQQETPHMAFPTFPE